MDKSTKTIIVLVVIVFLLTAGLALALIQYGRSKEAHKQEREKLREELSEQKDINEGLARIASNQVTHADLEKIVRREMKGIQSDLDKLDGKVTAVSRVTGRLEASTGALSASDSISTAKGVLELHKDIAWMASDGSQSIPVAWAKVRPAGDDLTALRGQITPIIGNKSVVDDVTSSLIFYLSDPAVPKWETGTYPLEFHITSATVEVGGESDVQTQYVQISASEPGSDERIPLAIVKADYAYMDTTAPEFRWWSPHLDGGIAGLITPLGFSGGGTLGFSAMSYGKTKSDNIWRFVRIGLGTDGEVFYLGLDPAGYNIARPLPVIDDVWIYLGLVVSSDGYGGSLSLTSTW